MDANAISVFFQELSRGRWQNHQDFGLRDEQALLPFRLLQEPVRLPSAHSLDGLGICLNGKKPFKFQSFRVLRIQCHRFPGKIHDEERRLVVWSDALGGIDLRPVATVRVAVGR